MRRRWLRALLGFLATAVVLALLVRYIGGAGALVDTLATAALLPILAALAIVAVNVVLAALRWRLVLAAMGHPLSLRRAVFVVLATWPLAVVLPSRAGDFVRAWHVRDLAPPMAATGSVLAEKAIDVQSLCVLSFVGCLAHGWYEWAGLALAVLAAEWIVVVAIVRAGRSAPRLPLLRRFPDKVAQLAAAFEALRRDRARLSATIALSLIAWVGAIGVLTLLFAALGTEVPPTRIASLWPISVFIGMLPLTVGGLGTRDASFLFLLQASGGTELSEPAILAGTLGYALLANWTPALVGLPFMFVARRS